MNEFFIDFLEQINSYYSDFVQVLPRVLLAILVYAGLMFLANRSRNYLSRRLTARMDDPLLAKFIVRVIKLLWIILGVLIVLKIVGLADIAVGLMTGASVSAVVVGFAFKDIAENFLAGIIMAFDRPFQVGDIVEIDGHQGKVVSLNLRNSLIKTFDGRDIYIPNASIIKNPVVNFTIDGFQRYEIEIGLDYGSDIEKAIRVCTEMLKSVSGVLEGDKAPAAYVTSLGASTLNLTAYYWLDTFDKKINPGAVKSEAIDKILDIMGKHGINLPGDIIEIKNYNNIPVSHQQATPYGT